MSGDVNLSFKDISKLRCPESRQPLALMDDEQLEALNAQIRDGEVETQDGRIVDRPLDAGLVREDGHYVYPIRDGVPNLLLADRIAW